MLRTLITHTDTEPDGDVVEGVEGSAAKQSWRPINVSHVPVLSLH